jgi:hypothetical protein
MRLAGEVEEAVSRPDHRDRPVAVRRLESPLEDVPHALLRVKVRRRFAAPRILDEIDTRLEAGAFRDVFVGEEGALRLSSRGDRGGRRRGGGDGGRRRRRVSDRRAGRAARDERAARKSSNQVGLHEKGFLPSVIRGDAARGGAASRLRRGADQEQSSSHHEAHGPKRRKVTDRPWLSCGRSYPPGILTRKGERHAPSSPSPPGRAARHSLPPPREPPQASPCRPGLPSAQALRRTPQIPDGRRVIRS